MLTKLGFPRTGKLFDRISMHFALFYFGVSLEGNTDQNAPTDCGVYGSKIWNTSMPLPEGIQQEWYSVEERSGEQSSSKKDNQLLE